MPLERLQAALAAELEDLRQQGSLKGEELVITDVVGARQGKGPRYHLRGEKDQEFIKMNSNGYLGMSLRPELIRAEEETARRFGVGPGAVRFISGTYQAHVDLEERLASFHSREAGMIFSSAYAAIMGVLSALISPETAVISDELNHNCIINAVRLSRPKEKRVYKHLDLSGLRHALEETAETCKRAVVVTDGIFSMRGDHAPLDKIAALAREYDRRFAENVILLVDDSHGIGACGDTGRGAEELTGAEGVDLLVATLGKALGVNGGYVVSSRGLVNYLREKAAFYIYSNPITMSEAAAALKAVEILDGPLGLRLLEQLKSLTRRFREGLVKLGYETLPGEHPVVPLMVRDTDRTRGLVRRLKKRGVLATGLTFPVVPRGDEEIRFQINADHTDGDIDHVLLVLEEARSQR